MVREIDSCEEREFMEDVKKCICCRGVSKGVLKDCCKSLRNGDIGRDVEKFLCQKRDEGLDDG